MSTPLVRWPVALLLSVAPIILPASEGVIARRASLTGISFSDEPGALYAPAREVARAFGLPYAYDAASDLAFVGKVALDHRAAMTSGDRLVRITALQGIGARVELGARAARVRLNGTELAVRAGKKRVVVDKGRQELVAYQGDRLVLRTRVSTGRHGGSTPNGTFRAGWMKDAYKTSSLYGDAPMPWAVHLTGNVFVHGYHEVPPYPASHGCVRLPMQAAEWFYRWVDKGTPVTVRGAWHGRSRERKRA